MGRYYHCQACNAQIPNLTLNEEAWNAIKRSLMNKSVALAVAELKYFAKCEDEDAKIYLDHVLSCVYAWPLTKNDEAILGEIEEIFSGIQKPDHFTDYTHCDECYEHDQTLRNSSRIIAKRNDFGNSGWDPITFSSGEGMAYYFPVLARFALIPNVWRNHDWYAVQLLWHLSEDGIENKLLAVCNNKQKRVVFSFLKHLEQTRKREISNHLITRELNTAIDMWSVYE